MTAARLTRALSFTLIAACASVPGARSPGEAWRALVDGQGDEAARAVERALAADGADALALFARATMAFERGQSAAAFADHLRLLELAAGDPRARPYAGAAAVRAASLLDEVSDRTAAEDRLLAVARDALPWQAQVPIGQAAIAAGRRRGDARLVEREVERARCLRRLQVVGRVGRLPRRDLEAPLVKSTAPRPLQAVGCRVSLPSQDGLPGVHALAGQFEIEREGEYDLVLDYAGPARLRVSGGRWHEHGFSGLYGPRQSAARVRLGAGPHTVELRLGAYGGTELAVLALPAAVPVSAELEPVAALAGLVEADAAGDVDRALGLAMTLSSGRFAVGLAAAARVVAEDPTRPGSIARDASRSLLSRAVATDPRLARAWHDLAALELLEDRPREAAQSAGRALTVAPAFWPAGLTLAEALRARGLERHADDALGASVRDAQGACPALEAALRRAQERSRIADENRLLPLVGRCDARSRAALDRQRSRGDLPAMEQTLRQMLPASADPDWLRAELAGVLLARQRPPEALPLLRDAIAAAPRDVHLWLRLADTHTAAGEPQKARALVADLVQRFPTRSEPRQAARLLGLALPLEELRLSGTEVIRGFVTSGRRYDAPAVMVLDRTVGRVFPDGAQLVLTHNVVRVQTKDGIDRWGEVAVPEGAEVLTLRTHKPNGTVREPEEIFGKPTISAPDLAPGDFVEWETMEWHEPSDAFAPGFVGDRFFFQSLELPLDRTEYLLVVPQDMALQQDARAGAPQPTTEAGPPGTRVLRFARSAVPQLFAERASVPHVEWIPSVRLSSGVSLAGWSRFVAEQVDDLARSSPALRKTAAEIRAGAAGADLARALVAWVNRRFEPEGGLNESATSTLARGRGNHAALMLALARALDVPADLVLARSLVTAAPDAPVVSQEIDDFSDLLVRFPAPSGDRFVDPRLRRAAFGYLPPAVAGAPAVVVGEGQIIRTRSLVPDRRRVEMTLVLAEDGSGRGEVSESLSGWPALEWAEAMDRAGRDRSRLRQDFEQRWLSHHFPGAALGELTVESGQDGTARVGYTFTHPQLAALQGSGGLLAFTPAFFRAEPGRRFGSEARRTTALMLGYDVPLELSARLRLPAGTRVLETGGGGTLDLAPGALFRERREFRAAASEIVLERHARLPIVRVLPAEYERLAPRLRQVDALERAEIRIAVPPRSTGAPAAQ